MSLATLSCTGIVLCCESAWSSSNSGVCVCVCVSVGRYKEATAVSAGNLAIFSQTALSAHL